MTIEERLNAIRVTVADINDVVGGLYSEKSGSLAMLPADLMPYADQLSIVDRGADRIFKLLNEEL